MWYDYKENQGPFMRKEISVAMQKQLLRGK